MSNSKIQATIGVNKPTPIQCVPYGYECCNESPTDLVVSIQDVIDQAVADGVTLPDGNPPTGVLSADIQLKPIGGECNLPGGLVFEASTSDALYTFTAIGRTRNIDPQGGIQLSNHLVDYNNDGVADVLIDPTDTITIAPGSVVVKGFTLV